MRVTEHLCDGTSITLAGAILKAVADAYNVFAESHPGGAEMVLNVISIAVMVGSILLVLAVVYWGLLSVGLQEADDPDNTRPEDMTEFEKRHTHRTDVHAKQP